MLKDIASYVTRFADVIAAVTGIDIEVVDADLLRVAGTGRYAGGVGGSIGRASAIYRTALERGETLFIDNPHENALCRDCPDRDGCQETLSLCTPIVDDGRALGIIGVVCFGENDRNRVLAHRENFTYFIAQMADVIARMARSEQSARADRRQLEILIRSTDQSSQSVLGDADNAEALRAIVGGSETVAALKDRVLQIAATSSTVLVTGESGTGKEMFARAIHAASPRRDKPFIAINCGAIPEALLESELFGYVRGAFTDASHAGRMGKFELADRGVLFLDEIGSMPLFLQVKLLRVLQERSFARLGSNKTVHVDIRVIAAANENLHELISQKMFREDLFYRLNVIPLEIPPLRERKEDIPALAEHFLARYCRLFDKPPARLSPDILDRLAAYGWPGNVREFENCIEYMVNMHKGGLMSASVLPAKIAAHPDVPAGRPVSASGRIRLAADPDQSRSVTPLAELERQAIHNALIRFSDSAAGKRKAAEALGIGVATLYRKLKELSK